MPPRFWGMLNSASAMLRKGPAWNTVVRMHPVLYRVVLGLQKPAAYRLLPHTVEPGDGLGHGRRSRVLLHVLQHLLDAPLLHLRKDLL